ncbi:MAG: DMT family transporter [Nodosilinea sp.]
MLLKNNIDGRSLPSAVLMLGTIASTQMGAILAKPLFESLGAVGASSLSFTVAALVLVLWRRPNLRRYSPQAQGLAAAMGLVLAAMTLCLYGAIARLPLGIAIALQFVGPLGLSAVQSCRRLDLAWVVLAATGIALLSPVGNANLDPLGMGLALLAGLLLAGYIVIATQVGHRFAQGEGAAIALSVSALALLPMGLTTVPHLSLGFLAVGAGVALLSTVVPLTLDSIVLKRTSAKTFGVLLSLEPAVAALLGLFFLGEQLIPRALVGIALVMVAAAGHARFQISC